MKVEDFFDKTKKFLDDTHITLDKVNDMVETANSTITHGQNAVNRIKSGETAREKERAWQIECKTDRLWSFFELLWIIIVAATVLVIFIF